MNQEPPSLELRHLVAAPRRSPASGERPPLLVLLHGVGSNERDLFTLAPYLDPRLLVVSVRAPIPLGPQSNAWYHVRWMPDGTPVGDDAEAAASGDTLLRFLPQVAAAQGADPARIYLMGFSQGAIMSLSIALLAPTAVRGIVLMSGRLLAPAWNRRAPDAAFAGFPVFVAHGVRDAVLPIADGRALRDALATLPVALTYREYDMAHEVSNESLQDIAAFLTGQLDL